MFSKVSCLLWASLW